VFVCPFVCVIVYYLFVFLYLRVPVPPRLLSQAEWTITALAGTEATLPCKVSGIPWPTVSWSRDQLEIDFYSDEHKYMMQDTGSLIIPSVDVEDAARYLCVAENPAGVVSQEITLVVHGNKHPV